MTITIRRMEKKDHAQVMSILNHWNMAPQKPTTDIPDPERSSLSIDHTLVAMDNERIIGLCSYILHTAEQAETASLAVDPEYRGKGIGFRLQHARLGELKQKGIRHVRTETDRAETTAWYVQNFGYRITGKNPKKHNFSLSHVDHWTVLELDLSEYVSPEIEPGDSVQKVTSVACTVDSP